MSAFALLRGADDLVEYGSSLSEFYVYRQRLYASARRSAGRTQWEPLLGIWICPQLVLTPPSYLNLHPRENGKKGAKVGDSTSLSTIWTLCWTDSKSPTVTRTQLVHALSAEAAALPRPSGQFIPVFDANTPPADVRLESRRLEQEFPGVVTKPVFQERFTGTFMYETVWSETTEAKT